jgi:DNA-binding response OmpR family regulator
MSPQALSFVPPPNAWRRPACDDRCQRVTALIIGEEHVRPILIHDPEAHEGYALPVWHVPPADISASCQFGPLRLNLVTGDVSVSTMPISLTQTEWKLLSYLACRPGRLIERNEITHAIWGSSFIESPAVLTIHLSRLRSKLWEAAPLIQTVFGRGLRLLPELP